MNKKLIRKMLTAAGGPLRIKLTPEEIALFESQATRVPGMNNSGGNRYREEGVLAQQHLEQEAKRKEEEIKSRMEMRPTLKRRATFSEKLRGKKDEYVPTTQIVGMSGADPLLSFYVGGVGLNGIGALAKTGLWNVAKYAPTTLLGNWGRGYFIGNTFKSSFNGSVPTLTSLATSLLYLPAKLNETGLSSLKFFERPTLSNGQELAGATKWERNFRPQWHVANYPGYLLKGLMRGSLLEKQLSKNGTININLLNAYFNKASQLEREVANKVLAEKFTGQKTIDYNLFKKAVLDELITYNVKPEMQYSTYGMDRLGFNVIRESNGNGGIVEYLPGIRTNTFTFESPRLPVGNNKHYDTTTLGHSRTYTTSDEPNILHVMESLSDWGQSHVKMMPSVLAHQIAIENALKSGNINAFHSFTNRFSSLLADKLSKYERMALENINKEIESGLPSGFLTIDDLWSKKYEILKRAGNRSNIGVQGLHLHDNYLQRLLQENLRYAAENGLTKMRYPTSETAAKIEGYLKTTPKLSEQEKLYIENFNKLLQNMENTYGRELIWSNPSLKELWESLVSNKEALERGTNFTYSPEHQTILKKYADFPKLFLKLYKGQNVRTVTDTKGNTWYEVDVPKGYLSREWLFKQGGKMNKLIKMLLGGLFKLTDYIKAIENPDSIGWNGRVWTAPTLKGYDKNQRGFGIDVNTNKEAKALTEGRPGRWLTDREANTLMNSHINYITKAANKHIRGFSKLSPKRQAALLGILYRGDSVNKSGINIYEPNDRKFFKSISNYYRSKGLNTRADNSDKFFNISNKLKMGGQIRKMLEAGKLLPFSEKQALDRHNEIAKQYFSSTPTISNLYNGAINWLKGHKILLPDGTPLLIGHPPIPGKIGGSSFELSKNASQGERIWKYLFDYVKKNPKVVEQSKSIPLGYTKGTEYTLEAKLPLEGLSVRNNTPLALENRVMNPAEKAAAEDYLSTVSRKINEEFPDVYVNTKLPTGRPSGEFRYPKEILEKYGFGKPKTTVKSNNVTRNTNIGNAKLSLTERYHDRKNYSRKEITLDKNNRAYETGKATPVNSGQSRVKIRLLENVSSNITKYPKHEQRALDKLKLKLAKKGLSRKEIERHKDVKAFYRRLADQYGYFKNGGLLEFLKNGSGIHIKKKNRGKFTEYCGGKVTQECIRKAKASGNPTLVKRATFADNARHFKHLLGGNIIFPNDSNPNAFGGVFENVLLGRLRDLELQYYRKKLKEQQALIDLLLEQLKSDVISNILGTAVNTGLNYLLKSKQEKAT